MNSPSLFKARLHSGIAAINAEEWDACAGTDDPFTSHAFLAALEETGCVGTATGWQALPITLEDNIGRIIAAMPIYAKSHSQGEYIFDHGWADAFMRAGGQYYPKLQCSVPFTPVTGRRFLIRPGYDIDICTQTLSQASLNLLSEHDLSSLHITFCSYAEAKRLEQFGFLHRLGQQYHWQNETYSSFEDFLHTLPSRKRKMIRKERESANTSGLVIQIHEGAALSEKDWDAFFAFYMDTGSRKSGRPYLNRSFFARIAKSMAERIVMVMARRDGIPIAGALNFKGANALYGRYWGCLESQPFLHFECCYYRAIDYAIAHGLDRVEAGAQGEHKLLRGYKTQLIHSAHWIADVSLRDAVQHFLIHERQHYA